MECPTIKNVLASAMKASLGYLFETFQCGAALYISRIVMGHQKTPTPVMIESAAGEVFVNDNTQKRTYRAIDMILYWVQDRVRQVHFLVYWEKVQDNLADQFTKNNLTEYHCETRITYIIPQRTTEITSVTCCLIKF